MGPSDFDLLMRDDTHPLPLTHRRNLRCLLAHYHGACREMKRLMEPTTIAKAKFDEFRVGKHNHDDKIVPWNVALPTKSDEALAAWNKSVRPNRLDYAVFKDEAHWTKAKESFLVTLDAQNLSMMAQDGYVVTPTEKEVDDRRKNWLYKIMQDSFQAPAAKTIVKEHKEHKDTREIWKAVCNHYDKSMTSRLTAQKISSYLTSTRLHTLSWNGTQSNFILHFKEQYRQYNEIATERYSDGLAIQFLEAALSGTPNLSQVLTTRRNAIAAASTGHVITFDEYVAALLEQTQVFDAGRKTSSNPRVQRRVNQMEITFDDDTTESIGTYEVESHDMETDIGSLMVNQNDTSLAPQRQRVWMDQATWKSLSEDDRSIWLKLSPSAKSSILGTDKKPATNGRPTQRFRRQSNVHQTQEPTSFPTDPHIEAGTHERTVKTTPDKTTDVTCKPAVLKSEPKTGDLLQMHLHDNTYSHADIAKVLSQPNNRGPPSREVSAHEYLP